jgi:hypothetical protein
MKPTIDLYCGSPIELESEKHFLSKLSADLLAQGQSALVFANFFPDRNPHQIDFLLVTAQCACHVELKKLTAPVFGRINGPWALRMPDNSHSRLGAKNPYRQALDGKFAISDQMHVFAAANADVPLPSSGGKFYKHLESVVCVFPELLPGSSVYEDHKVRVRGYNELLAFLLRQRTKPPWTRAHWIAFAMHLGLVRADEAEDRTPPEIRAAQQVVCDYGRRFHGFYGRGVAALVPTSIQEEGQAVSSDSLLPALQAGGHVQIVGPSGCGKSLLAKHMALASIRAGGLPILASAKEYEGKLSSLLDRSVAHLYPDTAIQFLQAAARTGNRVALILDGFNECPQKRRKDLVKDLQAFYLRWSLPIVITTQEPLALPEPLQGKTLRFAPLNGDQKLAVLRSYAGDRVPADADSLCEAFHTPFELSLVADCLTDSGARDSRAALFDAYIGRRCEQTSNPALVRSILCAVADRMRRRLLSSLPASDVRRVAATTLGHEGGRMHHLAEALACGLLDMRQGRCAFRHELLERSCQAEALVRECGPGEGLAKALILPRNRGLTEFVIGLETEPAAIRRYLEGVAEHSVLCHCLRGRYGEIAREVAIEDCSKLLQAAERALEGVDVQLVDSGPWKQLVLTGSPSWSGYDVAVMNAIGNVIPDGIFLNESLRLIAHTDDLCQAALAGKPGKNGTLPLGEAAQLFAALYVWMHGDDRAFFPASAICRAGSDRERLSAEKPVTDAVLNVAATLESRTPGELLLLCNLLHSAGPDLHPVLPRLIRKCWKTAIYHLRAAALQMAEWNAATVQGEARDEIKAVIGALHSRNALLSTRIVDAMLRYDMVEPFISPDGVAQDLHQILRSPEDPTCRELAHHIVASMFEEVYQEAYWDEVHALSQGDRVLLLTMAALGAPEGGLCEDWALKELLRLGDKRALPAFEHWATRLDTKECFAQQAAWCYVLGVIGCARFLAEPPALLNPQSDVERAWQAYGNILFWLYKPGLSPEQRRAAAALPWQQLQTEWPFDAVDPLMQLEDVILTWGPPARRVVDDLCAEFRDQVRQVLEFGLKNRARLTGFFGRMPMDGYEFARMVGRLAAVGDRRTARLLESFVETPDLGRLAVEAVRQLKSADPDRLEEP